MSSHQYKVTVIGIGEPLEPDAVYVDLQGADPEAVPERAAQALGIQSDALDETLLVTEDGFEKTDASNFVTASELQDFLDDNRGDCYVEVRLVDAVMVSLWDTPSGGFLARTDIRHLCRDATSLSKRYELLVPLVTRPTFFRGFTFAVNGDESLQRRVDEESFREAFAIAAAGGDVIFYAPIVVPDAPQPPLVPPPVPRSAVATAASHSRSPADALADRVQGVLWGAALGDATGLATEFLSKAEVAARQAELGPACRCAEDAHRARWAPGDWTEDTDQLLLVLDSVIAGQGVLNQRALAGSLKRWMSRGFAELGDEGGVGISPTLSQVLEHPAYDVAPDIAADAVWRQGACTDSSNDAVARCAAGALPYFWDDEVTIYNATAGANVTHADPRCVASCVAVCHLIAATLATSPEELGRPERRVELVAAAVRRACSHLTQGLHSGGGSFSARMARAGAEAELTALAASGGGLEGLALESEPISHTFKPVAAAFWAFKHGTSFKEAVAAIAAEAGAATANAAVAGAVLGARFGFSQLPGDWLAAVPQQQRSLLAGKAAVCLGLLGLGGTPPPPPLQLPQASGSRPHDAAETPPASDEEYAADSFESDHGSGTATATYEDASLTAPRSARSARSTRSRRGAAAAAALAAPPEASAGYPVGRAAGPGAPGATGQPVAARRSNVQGRQLGGGATGPRTQPPLGLLPSAAGAAGAGGGFGGIPGSISAAAEAELVDLLAQRYVKDRGGLPNEERSERDALRDMLRGVAWNALEPAAAHELSLLISRRWLVPVSSAEGLRAFRQCLHKILADERVLDIVEHEMACHFSRSARLLRHAA